MTHLANMTGGLLMRVTPVRRLPAANTRRSPQRSLSRKMERSMTRTGEEKRMVVESPRGRREKEVKTKTILRPPAREMRARRAATLGALRGVREAPFHRRMAVITTTWRSARVKLCFRKLLVH